MTRVNTLKDIEAIYLESIQSINEGGGDPSSVSAALLDDEDVDHYKQTGEIRKKETPRLRDRLKDKIQKLSTSKNISAMSKAGNNYDQFSLGTFEETSSGNLRAAKTDEENEEDDRRARGAAAQAEIMKKDLEDEEAEASKDVVEEEMYDCIRDYMSDGYSYAEAERMCTGQGHEERSPGNKVAKEGTGSRDHEYDEPHRKADRAKFSNDPGYQQLRKKHQDEYNKKKHAAKVAKEGTGSRDHEYDEPHRKADREKFEKDPGFKVLQKKMQDDHDFKTHRKNRKHEVAKEGNKGTKADRELADTDNDGKLADWEKAKTNAIRKAQNKSHLCAKTVNHENYGPGGTVHGHHAIPDVNGNIEWYMVEFKHGTEKIMTENLEIVFAVEHYNH